MSPRPFAELARDCVVCLEQQCGNVLKAHERFPPWIALFFSGAHLKFERCIDDLTKWEQEIGNSTDSNETHQSNEAVHVAEGAVTASLSLIKERATAIGSILQVGKDVSSLSDQEQCVFR
jgi:hypothetical protein